MSVSESSEFLQPAGRCMGERLSAGVHAHEPVLLEPVLKWLEPRSGQVVLDCTVGLGGHAEQLARAVQPAGQVLCVDVDPDNLAYAQKRLAAFKPVCRFFHANFAEARDVLAAAGRTHADIVLVDLGASTNQLIGRSRGLSFSVDAPLDMRLDPRLSTTAADLIARLSEKELADLLYRLSEERWSRRIARRIVQVRQTTPITTTGQLAAIVRQALRSAAGASKIDPATRTFQALRMAVNRELENLDDLLAVMPTLLQAGGRAAVISFHSGEDRRVKHAMLGWQQQELARVLTKKPVVPDEVEMAKNPRCRSAKLRVAEFISRPG